MTYNFDPDRWFDNEETALRVRRARGELDEAELETELEKLTERYEEMVERLDIRHDYSKTGEEG